MKNKIVLLFVLISSLASAQNDSLRPYNSIKAKSIDLKLFPRPILTDNPDWVNLYYRAIQTTSDKMAFGTAQNGFVKEFIDQGQDQNITQWDACFSAAFAMYLNKNLSSMKTIDNFYSKQQKNGSIYGSYRKNDGQSTYPIKKNEAFINPPLFAWIEWRYYVLTGDMSRFSRVLPILSKYYEWIEANYKSKIDNKLYTTSLKASVMENLARKEIGSGIWIDLSAQQALAAQMVANIADVLGEKRISDKFWNKYQSIFEGINKNCWDANELFFYDKKEDGSLLKTKHIGSFWTLLSECYSSEKLPGLMANLKNPFSFYTLYPFPSLAVNDKNFNPNGHFWNGGVWSETNFMVLESLAKLGEFDMAYQAASSFLTVVSDVFNSNKIQEKQIIPAQKISDSYHTSWECYSPTILEPGRGLDSSFLCKQNAVNSLGLAAIAILFEHVIGLDIQACTNSINWHIYRKDRHGIQGLNFAGQTISLVCSYVGRDMIIDINAEKVFDLMLIYKDKRIPLKIHPGKYTTKLKM